MDLFSQLAGDIAQTFTDVFPKEPCMPCFTEGLAKGAIIGIAGGAVTVALLAALAASAPVAAAVIAAALAVLGVAAIIKALSDMRGMNDKEKSKAWGELIGGLAGAVAGGGAAGRGIAGAKVPVLAFEPSYAVSSSGSAVMTGASVTVGTASAATAGQVAGAAAAVMGTAMMMSGGGSGSDRGSGDDDGGNDRRDKGKPSDAKENELDASSNPSSKSEAAPLRPGTVTPNKLQPHELAFAEEIVRKEGGDFVGPPTNNTPGIDGHLDGKPVSLKETNGPPTAVLRNAVKAAKQATNAGEKDVELFIRAPNVGRDEMAEFAKAGPLSKITDEGSISKIKILTQDGWLELPED